MPVEQRLAFQARAARDPRLEAITFEARVESFFEQARGVVAMGGYNTFCEILSFGKPALLVPRTTPRLEQYLRAERAQRLGLVRMLPDDGTRAPALMAAALRALPAMPVLAEEVRSPDAAGAGADHQAGGTLAGTQPARSASCAAAGTPDRLAAACRRPGQGLPAPVGDLHRPGDPGAGAAGSGARDRLAAPSRPTAGSIPCTRRSARRCATCRSISIRSPGGCCARSCGCCRGARSGGCCASGWATSPATSRPTAAAGWARPGCWRPSCPRRTDWLHVHYLHTPASVARYAAILRGLPYSISAHAKDVWTIPDWEKREKIADAAGWSPAAG